MVSMAVMLSSSVRMLIAAEAGFSFSAPVALVPPRLLFSCHILFSSLKESNVFQRRAYVCVLHAFCASLPSHHESRVPTFTLLTA